jgi:undecaprenyl-diphosphatase
VTTLLSGGAMAVALIVYEWHYATDTIGGACTAIAVILGSALALDRAASWWAQRAK